TVPGPKRRALDGGTGIIPWTRQRKHGPIMATPPQVSRVLPPVGPFPRALRPGISRAAIPVRATGKAYPPGFLSPSPGTTKPSRSVRVKLMSPEINLPLSQPKEPAMNVRGAAFGVLAVGLFCPRPGWSAEDPKMLIQTGGTFEVEVVKDITYSDAKD